MTEYSLLQKGIVGSILGDLFLQYTVSTGKLKK